MMTDRLKKFDRSISFHRVFVTLTGSVTGALMLSQAVYWQLRCKSEDGWWWKTQEEWWEEVGLTRHELDTAKRDCKAYIATKRCGVPCRSFFKVDADAIGYAIELLEETSSLPESGELVRRNPADKLPGKRRASNNTEMTLKRDGAFELPEDMRGRPEFVAAWADWQQHRREIRHALTPLTAKQQLGMLRQLGCAKACATIRKSIEHGWQGLFPDKADTPANGRGLGAGMLDHADAGHYTLNR